MIELTSLNGKPFVLNDNLIETIECIPETKIMLTTGKFMLVAEDKDEVIKRIIAFRRQIHRRSEKQAE